MGPAEALDVGRKKSESRKYNTLVRLDDEMVEKAKKVAALKGITLAEYFSDILRPVVNRDLTKEAKKLAKEEGGEE
jgi:predicted DNA binding CopG/RHH family protein